MGVRKREVADARKEANKSVAFAKLNNCPTSPRKMRLVADLVRGQKVELALNILRFSQKEASRKLEKLLLSAINNYVQKNEDANLEEASVVCQIKNAFVIHPIGGKMEYVSSLQDTLELVRVNNKWLIRKDIPQQNGKQSHD